MGTNCRWWELATRAPALPADNTARMRVPRTTPGSMELSRRRGRRWGLTKQRSGAHGAGHEVTRHPAMTHAQGYVVGTPVGYWYPMSFTRHPPVCSWFVRTAVRGVRPDAFFVLCAFLTKNAFRGQGSVRPNGPWPYQEGTRKGQYPLPNKVLSAEQPRTGLGRSRTHFSALTWTST